MTLTNLNLTVLLVALACLLAQLCVSKKHVSHILFAIFCGSIVMTLAQQISAEKLGAYQYLIGLGAVATCNGYWLLSRTLFRKTQPIAAHHLALALFIAGLMVIKQGYAFASSSSLISEPNTIAQQMLTEATILLSSCILVLSFWEGCRGFSAASKQEQKQRVLFLTTFGGAICISKFSQAMFADSQVVNEAIKAVIILFVVVNTQVLLIWQQKTRDKFVSHLEEKPTQTTHTKKTASQPNQAELLLARQVATLLQEEQLFLQANLKVADIARALDVPEYRISKALRTDITAKNFNHYINQLRIDYAQQILLDESKQQWSVLVVGLESGFASVGPFTRAFKSQTGLTPNQYRQQNLLSASLKVG